MKRIFSFLIPIIIAIKAAIVSNNILDKKISYLSDTKDLSKFATNYGDFSKDRSIVAKKILGERGDLFLVGSSEMKIKSEISEIILFIMQLTNLSMCNSTGTYILVPKYDYTISDLHSQFQKNERQI